jgi:hypothetical protein
MGFTGRPGAPPLHMRPASLTLQLQLQRRGPISVSHRVACAQSSFVPATPDQADTFFLKRPSLTNYQSDAR